MASKRLGVSAGLEVTLAEWDAVGKLAGRAAEVALLRELAGLIESEPNAQLVKQYREALEALHRGDGEDEARSFAEIVAGIAEEARGGQT